MARDGTSEDSKLNSSNGNWKHAKGESGGGICSPRQDSTISNVSGSEVMA